MSCKKMSTAYLNGHSVGFIDNNDRWILQSVWKRRYAQLHIEQTQRAKTL